MLKRYFRKVNKGLLLLVILLANAGSMLVGYVLVTPFQFTWDSLAQKASEQLLACVVAFLVTIPVEALIAGWFPSLRDRQPRWHAVFYANFITYAICIAIVIYGWRWGHYVDQITN